MNLSALKDSPAKKAIICGSGVKIRPEGKPTARISYADIPNCPITKLHKVKKEEDSNGVLGHKYSIDVYDDLWVLNGRLHRYEGYSWEDLCFMTQLLADNGIEEVILTNAAGGINPAFKVGDIMQIIGFLNFLKPGKDNLTSLKEALERKQSIGTYYESLNADLVDNNEPRLHKGVYIGVHGPNYESDSEVQLFHELNADAVGMSTIPEIETAKKNGMKIQAFSIITNTYGLGGNKEDVADNKAEHESVVDAGNEASPRLVKLLNLD